MSPGRRIAATVAVTPVAPVLVVGLLGVVPLALVSGRDRIGVLVAACLLGALAAGTALDDTAAVTLDPSPTRLRLRSAVRAGVALTAVTAVWAVQAGVVRLVGTDEPVPFGDWFLLQLALATATLAVAATVARVSPGRAGAAAAPTGLLLCAATILQWQVLAAAGSTPVLVLIPGDPRFGRWLVVVAVAAGVLGWETRDRAARGCRRHPIAAGGRDDEAPGPARRRGTAGGACADDDARRGARVAGEDPRPHLRVAPRPDRHRVGG